MTRNSQAYIQQADARTNIMRGFSNPPQAQGPRNPQIKPQKPGIALNPAVDAVQPGSADWSGLFNLGNTQTSGGDGSGIGEGDVAQSPWATYTGPSVLEGLDAAPQQAFTQPSGGLRQSPPVNIQPTRTAPLGFNAANIVRPGQNQQQPMSRPAGPSPAELSPERLGQLQQIASDQQQKLDARYADVGARMEQNGNALTGDPASGGYGLSFNGPNRSTQIQRPNSGVNRAYGAQNRLNTLQSNLLSRGFASAPPKTGP